MDAGARSQGECHKASTHSVWLLMMFIYIPSTALSTVYSIIPSNKYPGSPAICGLDSNPQALICKCKFIDI